MTGKLRTEQPIHTEIAQHESGWWLPAQVGGSFEKWRCEARSHIDAALERVQSRAVAVQAGCHVALWARYLAEHFDKVHTFEADPVNYRCAERNVADYPRIALTKAALGARCGASPWYRSLSNSGKHKLASKGKVHSTVDVVTIDSLDLPACDLICLDIEGYELPALRGAKATIDKYRPVILFEDLGHAAWHGLPRDGVQKFLAARNYAEVAQVDNDHIWAPVTSPSLR